MKKVFGFLVAAAVAASFSAAVYAQKAGSVFKPFAVYVENNSKENHYAPSGWMGDYGQLEIGRASCRERV